MFDGQVTRRGVGYEGRKKKNGKPLVTYADIIHIMCYIRRAGAKGGEKSPVRYFKLHYKYSISLDVIVIGRRGRENPSKLHFINFDLFEHNPYEVLHPFRQSNFPVKQFGIYKF